jgi:hypothetical protein
MVITTLLAATVCGQASMPQSINLKYKYTAGQVINYKESHNFKADMQVDGKSKPLSESGTRAFAYKVLKVSRGGNATIKLLQTGGTAKARAMTVEMGPVGRVDAGDVDGSLDRLPGGPAAVGTSWETTLAIKNLPPITVHNRVEAIQEVNGVTYAILHGSGNEDAAKIADFSAKGVKVSGSVTVDVVTRFNVTRGWLESTQVRGNMTIDGEHQGHVLHMLMDISTTVRRTN